MKKNNKIVIHSILWQDAAFSMATKLPIGHPLPTLTVGYIYSKNRKFTNISTSFSYKNEVIIPKDGFLIPNKSIIKISKIGKHEKK